MEYEDDISDNSSFVMSDSVSSNDIKIRWCQRYNYWSFKCKFV